MSNIRRNKEIARFIGEPKHDAASMQSIGSADVMNEASSYYMGKSNALKEIAKWELEAITMGTSFIKTTWEFEEGEKPGREIGEDGAQLMEPTVVYDGIKLEHRPLYSIFIDPKVQNQNANVDDMEFIIDQRYVSADSIMNTEGYTNQKDVVAAKRKRRQTTREDEIFNQDSDQIMDTGSSGVEARDKQSDQILVNEYWGLVPEGLLNGRNKKGWDQKDLHGFVDGHVILAEDIVVFAEENPYPKGRKPYDVIKCYPSPNQFYSIGIPELVKPLQRGLNAIVNQRLDNVSLVLNRMWAYRRGTLDPKTLVSAPGRFIPMRGDPKDGLMPIDTKDVTQSSYMEQESFDNMIQKFSGVSDIFFGQTDSGRRSAREATLNTEMGAGMMEEIVAGQVQDGFIPLMEKVRDYIQEYSGPLPLMVKGEMTVVQPEDLSGDFVLIPTIGEQMFTKSAEMQKSVMLLEITMQAYEALKLQGKEVDIGRILEKIYEGAGWKDYNAIIHSTPQAGQEGGPQGQRPDGAAQLSGAGGGAASAAGAGGGRIRALPSR